MSSHRRSRPHNTTPHPRPDCGDKDHSPVDALVPALNRLAVARPPRYWIGMPDKRPLPKRRDQVQGPHLAPATCLKIIEKRMLNEHFTHEPESETNMNDLPPELVNYIAQLSRVDTADLITLAKSGCLDMVILFQEQRPNDFEKDKNLALRYAAYYGHLPVVKHLVEHGANVHASDGAGSDAPMREAAENGQFEVVQYLVEKGADVRANNGQALYDAAEKGHLEVVKLLLRHGADVHAEDDWALYMAARNGHPKVVEYLIEHGADVHAENDYVLREAVRRDHVEVVKILVEHGANVRAEDNYALREAVRRDHVDMIKILVEHGADVHAEDDYALRMAAQKGHLEVVRLLLDHGANVHAENNEALRYAAENGHLEVVQRLMEHGAKVHAHKDEALIAAATFGHFEVVKYLVEKHGADVHADNDGALTGASQKGHLEVVTYLSDYYEKGVGDNPFPIDRALLVAAERGHLEVVKYLVETRGANVHYSNDAALRYASEQGRLKVVQYLVEQHGADVHASDPKGPGAPLRQATTKDHDEVVRYLLDHQEDVHANDDEALREATKPDHPEVVKTPVRAKDKESLHKEMKLLFQSLIEQIQFENEKGVIQVLQDYLQLSPETEKDFLGLAAARKGSLAIVKLLVEHGANVHANDNEALREAVASGHLGVVKYLEDLP